MQEEVTERDGVRRNQDGLVRIIERQNLSDERIVEAFGRIAREDFVPGAARDHAYRDRPVSIPEGQTTSQPSLIARMLDAVAVCAGGRALEIGTGYGFQTALLAQLAGEVVSVERWPGLAESARANLLEAGVSNVEIHTGDGTKGWPDRAPYDAIVVSATARVVPGALVEQLTEGGRLVIPLLDQAGENVVLFAARAGILRRLRVVTPARFVPLVPGVLGS